MASGSSGSVDDGVPFPRTAPSVVIVVDGVQFVFVTQDALYQALDERLRIRIEVDLVVRPMCGIEQVAQFVVRLPCTLKDADGLPVLECDREFIDGADPTAADHYRIRCTDEEQIATAVAEAGIDDDVHVVDGKLVGLHMLALGRCR